MEMEENTHGRLDSGTTLNQLKVIELHTQKQCMSFVVCKSCLNKADLFLWWYWGLNSGLHTCKAGTLHTCKAGT
jgi:hypothetical protein